MSILIVIAVGVVVFVGLSALCYRQYRRLYRLTDDRPTPWWEKQLDRWQSRWRDWTEKNTYWGRRWADQVTSTERVRGENNALKVEVLGFLREGQEPTKLTVELYSRIRNKFDEPEMMTYQMPFMAAGNHIVRWNEIGLECELWMAREGIFK